MGIKRKLTEKLKSHRLTADLVENYGKRTAVFAFVAAVVTVAFATMNLVGAILYESVWYASVSAYYFILLICRGGVLTADAVYRRRRTDDGQRCEKFAWTVHLASGAAMVLLEVALASSAVQMIVSKTASESNDIMAIATAAYAFFKMGLAVYNLFKARKFDSPFTQALRNISFADACMSIASLTVLLTATFSKSAEDKSKMLYVEAAVIFAACAAIIAVAAIMIIRSVKKIKELKNSAEKNGD